MPRHYLLITEARLQPQVPRCYDDAHLDHWGEVYRANAGLGAIGITFEIFLQAPQMFLDSATHHILVPLPEGRPFYALLPAQRAVQERLDAEDAGQLSLSLGEAA